MKELLHKFWKLSKTNKILTIMFMALLLGILTFSWKYWIHAKNKIDFQQTGNIKNSPNVITGDNSSVTFQQPQEEKNNKQQIKIRVDRVLEDAELEIPTLKASFDMEFSKFIGKLNARGILFSGARISGGELLVKEFNTKVDDLLLKVKRKIEDILFEIPETNLGSVPYLSAQAKRYEKIKMECSNTQGYFAGIVEQFEKKFTNR